MRLPALTFASLVLATGLTAPVFAEETAVAEPKVNQLIVFGHDPCPVSTADTITVCARKEESERFRIPAPLRENISPQNEAWNNKVIAYETVGRSGTMSCSPVGAGGWTGCTGKMIKQAYAEKSSDPSLHFSELIAAERARRLSTLDTEAAETQSQVEQIEKSVEARQRAEQQALEMRASTQNPPAPTSVPHR